MSTLRLSEKPKPLLPGCRVTLDDINAIGFALKRLKRLCSKAGRASGIGRTPGRDFAESKGQKRRREHARVLRRRRGNAS